MHSCTKYKNAIKLGTNTMSTNKKKKVEQIKGRTIDGHEVALQRTSPFQLSLFQTLVPDFQKYSKTIELYDAIPKYYASPKKMAEMRHSGRFLDVLEREFKHKGEHYKTEITPARIKRNDIGQVEYYPTARENLVEEALRKIATDTDQGLYVDGLMGVKFTLYQLQNELKRMGHSIKYPALIDALTICNKANLSVTNVSSNNKPIFSSPIFPVFMRSSRDDWLENPKTTYCYVQFNMLVTQSLRNLTYRQFDYDTFMKCRKPLSRWLHRRLYHNFTQAKVSSNYEIKTSTIVRDSGLIAYEGVIRKQVTEVESTLKELKEQGVIHSYHTKKHFEGRKLIDAVHSLRPSFQFSDDIVLANQHLQSLEKKAEKAGKLTSHFDEEKGILVKEIAD